MSHILRDARPRPYIEEFEFEVALKSGERKEFEYEFDGEAVAAEVEYHHGDQHFEWRDARALQEVLGLMAQLGIREDVPPTQLVDRALRAIGVVWEWVERLELEVAFSTGKEIEFEYTHTAERPRDRDDEFDARRARDAERDELAD